MTHRIASLLLSTAALAVGAQQAVAADPALDEFRIKRKEVYEFTQSPRLTRNGDDVVIRFAVKDRHRPQ